MSKKAKGWLTRGKLMTYDVRFKRDALLLDKIAVVYELRPRRWFPGFRWVRVWERTCSGWPYLPEHFKNAARLAVEEYEEWKLAWEEHKTKNFWKSILDKAFPNREE